jgi:transposase
VSKVWKQLHQTSKIPAWGADMKFISGESRNQIILLPDSIEDYVEDNNSARVIDVYINSLDLKALGFSRPQPHDTGRPM